MSIFLIFVSPLCYFSLGTMLDHIIYMIKFAGYSAILADFRRICQTEEILTNEIYERYI